MLSFPCEQGWDICWWEAAVPAWGATRPSCLSTAAPLTFAGSRAVDNAPPAAWCWWATRQLGPALWFFLRFPTFTPAKARWAASSLCCVHTGCDWNLVVACDMPGLSAEFLAGLVEAARPRRPPHLLPAGPGGHREPLCAVYHRRALAALDRLSPRACAVWRGARRRSHRDPAGPGSGSY